MNSRAAEHAHHLSVEIGARPPTSAEELAAANYCSSVFEGAGLDVVREPFQGLRSFGHIYIPTTASIFVHAVGSAMSRRFRPLLTAFGLLSMIAFYGEQSSRFRWITRVLARSPSQNVIAKLRPKQNPEKRLVLVAHVDSSRSGLAFHPKVAKDFRRNTLIGIGAGIASLVAWLLPTKIRRAISAICSFVVGNGLFFLVHREVAGRDVAGANDNASGAGVLLALAETLAADPPDKTEIWFVATGCEESDLVGMSAFVQRHASELRDAWFLNFDTVAGHNTTLRWITTSTILEPLRADAFLVELAQEVAEKHPEFLAEPGEWRAAGLDADVVGVRGMRQMSLVAQTVQGTLPNWHWPTDTYKNLDEQALQRCYEFALELVRTFDSA